MSVMLERDFEPLDVVPVLVVALDAEGRIIRWNAACAELTGFTLDEVRGRRVWDMFSFSAEAEPTMHSAPLRAGSLPAQFENCWVTRRGDRRWFAWVTKTISIDGGVDAVIATGFDITERKREEAELRRSEERFRRLISTEDEYAIFLVDPDSRVISWNAGAERITGYRAGEIVGKDLSVLYPPEEVREGRPRNLLEQATRDGRVRKDEWRGRKDGSRFWARVTTIALRGEESGTVVGFGQIVSDETDRKVAEDALRESEEKFARIVSLAGEAIVVLDREGHIVVFNEAAQKMYAYANEEVLGKHFTLLYPTRSKSKCTRNFEEFIAGSRRECRLGERAGIPLTGRRKGGDEFAEEAVWSKLGEDESMLVAVVRDISELKQTEDEHHFLDAAWRALVSSLDANQTITELSSLAATAFADWCVLVIVDDTGQIRRFKVATANSAHQGLADQLEKLPIDEARPHLTSAVIATRHAVLISELPEGALETIAQSAEQLELLRQMAPKSFMAVPLIARGRLVGAAAFLSSESGHRFDARDLRVAEELARRAALAIDNATLFRASQLALRARDEVLGVVAHDLRNLLNSLLLAGGALERALSTAGSAVRQLVEMCLRPAKRMNRLIQDLLDVTSIEAGKLALERTRQPAAVLIDEAVELTRPVVAGHTMDVQVPRDLPDVLADSGRIMEVFSNIIGNAAKFTPAGGRITVGAQRSEGTVRFWVGDSGPGIPSGDLPHVFDRFWSAKQRESGGAGLGLAISKGIVEGHGGRIWVESPGNGGATFYFELPSADPAQPSMAATTTYH